MDTLINVPVVSQRVLIPMTAIQSVANQIAAQYKPEKIILFGSYAYGQPKPESDVDLLVIMETPLSELKQAALICRQIPYHFGIDLLVCTPQRLAQRLEWGDQFLREIIQRGKIVYESAHN